MTSTITITDQVKSVFERVTFMDFSTVDLNASLEDDLGIDMDSDYPRIVSQLTRHFRLPTDAEELLLDAETLKQVVDVVEAEAELG